MARQFGNKHTNPLREHREALERAAGELPQVTVAHGESEFLRAEAANRLRDAWLERHPDGDLALLRAAGEGKALALADIVAEMSGGSLFAREKLVVVRQAERALFPGRAGDAAEAVPASGGDREKGFLALLDNPPKLNWLILESAQLPKNRILGKRLAASAFLVPCGTPTPRDIPEWLDGRVSRLGKRLDDAAADLLIQAHGTDLGVLAGELDKLALFAGNGKAIDAAMVGEFLTGSVEFDIFGFTNAVEARNQEQALLFARRITLQGARDQRGKREDGVKAAHRVLSMLGGTVQGLLRAGIARARGTDAAEFAAAERLSPWRASRLIEAAGRFSVRELRMMVRETAEQLRRVHDTGGDPLLALETMAVKFTARRRNA